MNGIGRWLAAPASSAAASSWCAVKLFGQKSSGVALPAPSVEDQEADERRILRDNVFDSQEEGISAATSP